MRRRLTTLAALVALLAVWGLAWAIWYRAAADTPKLRLPRAGVPLHR